MNESPLGSEEVVEFAGSGWEWSFLDKSSGEKLTWSGGPDALGRVVRDALPKGLFGVFFVMFTLVWMTAVVRGGNNKWDRGQAVEPFAPHNVRIATFAGLWFLPPGLWMLTWPLQAWWKARSTRYILTNRRAIVAEPRLRGGFTILSYSAEDLALLRCEEFGDGIGDLVFEERQTWINGMRRSIGFLAIGQVREVERAVRQMLANGSASLSGSKLCSSGGKEALASLPRTYELGVGARLQCLIALVVGMVVTLALTAFVLALPIVFLVVPWPGGRGQRAVLEGPLAMLVGFLAILVGALVCGLILRTAIRGTTVKITINEEHELELSSWLRTSTLSVRDLIAVQAGSLLDPHRTSVYLRHKGGKQHLINQFVDFRDFLITIKALNPSVEIKGF